MKKLLLLFFLHAAFVFSAAAQGGDSLYVQQAADGKWAIRYRVQPGEQSVFDVARKFALPAAGLADANGLSYAEKLAPGTLMKIPLSLANWYNYTPPAAAAIKPLYMRATSETETAELAEKIGVSKKQFSEWNRGLGDRIRAGSVVAVGWVSTAAPISEPAQLQRPPMVQYPADTVNVLAADTAASAPPKSALEQQFSDQTFNGTYLTTEKGPVAFFPSAGGTVNGVHYAFHNSAARGSIVRVHNPGTGKTVFVKVIGTLPATKQYAGALIGISAAAKGALGVRDTRAWCEVSY